MKQDPSYTPRAHHVNKSPTTKRKEDSQHHACNFPKGGMVINFSLVLPARRSSQKFKPPPIGLGDGLGSTLRTGFGDGLGAGGGLVGSSGGLVGGVVGGIVGGVVGGIVGGGGGLVGGSGALVGGAVGGFVGVGRTGLRGRRGRRKRLPLARTTAHRLRVSAPLYRKSIPACPPRSNISSLTRRHGARRCLPASRLRQPCKPSLLMV